MEKTKPGVFKNILCLATITLALLSASGCAATLPSVAPNAQNPYRTIALLPIYNATADVGAPKMIRAKVFTLLDARHYDVMALDDTDKILSDRLGITLGTQAELAALEAFSRELGADAILYGYLLDFDSVTVGVYNVKKVKMAFKLVDLKTGAVIWTNAAGVKAYTGPIGGLGNDPSELISLEKNIPGVVGIRNLSSWKVSHSFKEARQEDLAVGAAFSLVEMLGTKIIGKHLVMETNDVLSYVFRDFPAGPGKLPKEQPAKEPEKQDKENKPKEVSHD